MIELKRILLSILVVVSFSACSNSDIEDDLVLDNNPNIINTVYRKGASNPTIVLEEYSDFFCPHCANVQPLLDTLLSEFPDQLALEYHHYSFMGSLDVHAGNECAGEQGKFWEFYEEAFKKQRDLRFGNRSTIVDLAADMGLNREEFETCLVSDKYVEKIDNMKKEGSEKYGINATPSFIVNGKKIEISEGYYESLKSAIEEAITQPFA